MPNGPTPRRALTAADGRKGGRATAERTPPDERKARSRRAYLTGAVNTVVQRMTELTPEQRAAIREAIDKA